MPGPNSAAHAGVSEQRQQQIMCVGAPSTHCMRGHAASLGSQAYLPPIGPPAGTHPSFPVRSESIENVGQR